MPTNLPMHAARSQRLVMLEHSIETASLRMAERDAFVASSAPSARTTRASRRFRRLIRQQPAMLWEGALLLQPPFACPVDLSKTQRLSDAAEGDARVDGGKWLCGAQLLRHAPWPCVVHSLGSRMDVSFELHVQQALLPRRCEIHVYDPTIGDRFGAGAATRFERAIRQRGLQLHQLAAAAAPGERNLTLMVRQQRHTYPAQTIDEIVGVSRCADIVKVDVEGAEHTMLEHAPWRRLCVGLLLFELHPPVADFATGALRGGNTSAFTTGEALRLIARLEAAGFRHYATEPVCPHCELQAEFAFVNVSWLRALIEAAP